MAMFGAGADFGMPQIDPSMQQPLTQPVNVPAPQKKGGLFGSSGGMSIDLSRALAGYLAGIGNPAGIQALNAMNAERQRKQEMAAQAQQYQQQREDGFQDWVRKQAYEAAHPSPVNNDTVADYNFWKGVLPPEKFQEWLENKVNPPQLMNVPGVGIVQVPRTGGGQAPTAPVGKLTPIDDGGPTPPASGGFPSSGY